MNHIFDNIVTDRPLTHDLFGAVTRKWPLIAADPPWSFDNWSEEGEDRNANQHYETMTLDQMKQLPVGDIAADDCALFLWVTDPTLPQAMELLKSWGFTYRSVAFYWAKIWEGADVHEMDERRTFPIGTGYGTRANPEQCWLATRGNPRRRILEIDGELKKDMAIRRLQFGPRTQHSAKPGKFYDLMTRLYEGPALEMFARNQRPGWACWGNQIDLLNEGPVRTKRRRKDRPKAPVPLFGEDTAA